MNQTVKGWLQKLLAGDAPENASLQSARLSLRGLFPWVTAILIVAVAAAAIIFLYTRERGRLGIFRRGLMAVLRSAAVGLIVFLLLRPTLVAEYLGERPRGVDLLIDNSLSMSLRDKRLSPKDRLRVAIAKDLLPPETSHADITSLGYIPTNTPVDPERSEMVRAVLSNPRLKLVDGLKRPGSLRTYLFGQHLRAMNPDANPDDNGGKGTADVLASFKADETRTALGDAVNELLLRKVGDLPSAIVVMTDGRDNASKIPLEEAARECSRFKVPLFIYGVGSTEGGLLQIRDAAVADTLFYEDTVAVPVRWRLQGIKEGKVEVTLALDGKEVARREVPAREGENREVLTFIPRKGQVPDEKANLVAAVKLLGNDTFKDDLKRQVRLIDRRVKVLYIENTPRWEYKFLQPALLRDRRVEASFLLARGDTGLLHSGPPFLATFPSRDKLFAFDLVILGDVPADILGKQHLEWLRDFVNEGGGLVLIAGQEHAPASYVDTPLAEVLPVEFAPTKVTAPSDARPQAYLPILTEAGQRSDMLALGDSLEENLQIWKTLPGWYWNYPVTKLRPGAVSLVDHPRLMMGDKPMPVLASQFYGKGQVLFLASPETWRWRYNVGDRHFARFWGQVVYRVGLPHLVGTTRRVQLAMEHSEILLNRPGSLYARLFDAEYQPLKEERISGRLETLDGTPGLDASRPLVLEAVPGQPGEYRTLLANDVPGRFEIKLDYPEAASLQYRVNVPPQHELEPAGMAEEPLRDAARISGGKFYREEDLNHLAADIEPQKAEFTQRQELLLWNPLALILFVGLVTVEWILRKFANLS